MRKLQHSIERINRLLFWDANKGYCTLQLILRVIHHYGNWGIMVQELLLTICKLYGYQIPE